MWLVNGSEIINLGKAFKVIIGPDSLLIFDDIKDEENYKEIRLEGNIEIIEGCKNVEEHIRKKITEIRKK